MRQLAVSYDWGRSIRIYNIAGNTVAEIHNEYANLSASLAFYSSDPILIAPAADAGSATTNAMLSAWNTETGKLLKHIQGPFVQGNWTRNRARAFSLAADGHSLAAITEVFPGNPLVLVNVSRGTVYTAQGIRGPHSKPDSLTCVDMSADGKLVAFGSAASNLAVLDTVKNKVTHIVDPFPDPLPPLIYTVKFDPAGTLLAAGVYPPLTPGPAAHIRNVPPLSYFVGIWEVPSGRLRAMLQGNLPPIRQVRWSTSGRLLAVADGADAIDIWSIGEDSAVQVADVALATSAVGIAWLGNDSALAVAVGDRVDLVQITKQDRREFDHGQ